MISLAPDKLRSLLCIGAHSDDIEIGCGGTILHLLERNPEIHVHWIVLSAAGIRKQEAQLAAESFLSSADNRKIEIHQFEDSRFPYTQSAALKDCFKDLSGATSPDLVLTHRQNDAHQDHRIVSDLTWQHFRDNLILEYEIPKYEGDLGQPNLFVPLNRKTAESKIDMLMDCFSSQREKYWFDRSAFEALMTIRGLECRAPEGLAEGFYSRKAVLFG